MPLHQPIQSGFPVGAVHSGADFQPLRVELVGGAGSFGGIGRGVWLFDMIFENECFRSQSIDFSG